MTSLTSNDGTNLFLADPGGQGGIMPNAATASFPSVVPFARWQRARDRTCAALLAGETRLLLTGPAGMGKTTLLQEVARILRYAGWTAAVETAGDEPPGRTLLAGPRTALLVDDADRLSEADLATLSAAHPGAMVLAGTDGVGKGFATAPRISLAPLDPAEARAYVSQWLALAGQHPARFDDGAIPHLIELAGGVPRFLSSLLSAAIWLSDAAGAEQVTTQQVDRAMVFRACFLEGEGDGAPGTQTEASAPAQTPPLPEPAPEPAAATRSEPRGLLPAAARRRPGVLVPALAGLALLCAIGAGSIYLAHSQNEEAAHLLQQQQQARLTPAEPAPVRGAEAAQIPAEAPAANPAEPAAGRPAEREAVSPAGESAVAMASASVVPALAAAPLAIRTPEPAPEPAVQPVRLPVEPPAAAASSADISPAPAQPAPAVTAEPPAPPAPAAAKVEEPPAPAASPAVEQGAARLPPALVEMLVRRGNEMLALGDISAARLLFSRAAQAGDVGAMLALGGTYDPTSSTDPQPRAEDLATAAQWYRLAAASGSAEAATRLQHINQHAAK